MAARRIRTHGDVRGPSDPDLLFLALAPTPRLYPDNEPAGHDPQPAVIGEPGAVAMEARPRGVLDAAEERLAVAGRDPAHQVAGEHRDPVPQAVLALQRGRTVEQGGLGDLQPGALQQRSILADARVIPGVFPGPQADRAGGRVEGRDDRGDVPPAAEFGHEPPARPERPPHARDGRLGRLDPVQHGVGEHRVERPVEREVAGIGDLEPDAREERPGLRDHLGRGVDAHHLADGLGEPGGQVAGAAAQVQHPLARPRLQQVDQRGAQLPDERMLVVVEAGVPLGRRRSVSIVLRVNPLWRENVPSATTRRRSISARGLPGQSPSSRSRTGTPNSRGPPPGRTT